MLNIRSHGLPEPNIRTIELGHKLDKSIPVSVNHPKFTMSLARRHGDVLRSDGSSGANEVMVLGGHTGTHIDALCHIAVKGQLHGGHRVEDVTGADGFAVHSVDQLPPIIASGILLDIASNKGVSRLEPAYEISPADVDTALKRSSPTTLQDAVVVIRTGWTQLWREPTRYRGDETGVPGIGEEAAHFLAEQGVSVVGSDTLAFEVVKAETGHSLLPVHNLLLYEHGIPIVEMLDLEELSGQCPANWTFICLPLRVRGATGSPVRPVAVY